MPGSFSLSTLDAPGNLQAVLQDGGSLVPNTTYYYKVLAYRKDYSFLTFSPRSASASITTTSTKKQVQLSWNAIPGFTPTGRYDAYIVLRNTTDSFKDSEFVCIMRTGETHYWNFITDTSFVDNGTYTMGQICNFVGGLPTLFIWGGSSNDPVTMWDLYQWCQTNAPGRVQPALNTDFMEFDDFKKEGMTWVAHLNLTFGYDGNSNQTVYFAHKRNGGLIIYGGIHSTSSANMEFGQKINVADADYSDNPILLMHSPSQSWGTLTGIVKLYGLRIVQGGRAWGSYAYSGWNNPYALTGFSVSSGSEMLDCDFAYKGNGYNLYGVVTPTGCRLPGLIAHPDTNLVGPKITLAEGLGFRHNTGATVTEPTVTYSTQDIIWRTQLVHTVIDGVFQSHSQEDNRPWLRLAYSLGLGGSLTFKQTLAIRVSDQDDNPLVGAQVTIKDVFEATVASGTTNADGKFDAGVLTSRVLTPTEQLVGVSSRGPYHEDTHVSNGDLARTMHTPHTVTIEKAGYETYRDALALNRKMDLEVALPTFILKETVGIEVNAAQALTAELFTNHMEVGLDDQ